jgi:hypothetical protein
MTVNSHPYLRAYMAGIVVPTIVLVLLLTAFVIMRFVCHIPVPVERAMIFPMGIVPSVFGLWNILYLRIGSRGHLPIGLHGALLPFLLLPIGYCVARALGVLILSSDGIRYFDAITIPYAFFALGFAFALAAYYLVWKYLIGFFNQVLGIA